MPHEAPVRVRLSPAVRATDTVLPLLIGDRDVPATLRIDRLSSRLVGHLSDRALDLIEIAAMVYAADAAVSRGPPTDPGMGEHWRRSFAFEVPVRDLDHWRRAEVVSGLCETLGFLSDDAYAFSFVEAPPRPPRAPYFKLDTDPRFEADEALLFSGGLDSLAGALEEMVSRKSRVLLVTHRSSRKLQGAQDRLVEDVREHVGEGRLFHVPLSLQLRDRETREHTHRTRSFFFAAICAAVAGMFGLDRVRFYENGVVSLNLPPAGQVVGTRATRSTHPQVLAGLSGLFSAVFERPVRVDNPFFWKTKTDVLRLIRDLGASQLVRHTRSCFDVRSQTIQSPHCGRCSQCIDRRFAAIAAGLEGEDPVDAYEIDPLHGPRPDVRDRELALGYVRNARRIAAMRPVEFLTGFGEAQCAIRHLGEPPGRAAERIFALHQRHGRAVVEVIDNEMTAALASTIAARPGPDSLVALAGRDAFSGPEPPVSAMPPVFAHAAPDPPSRTWEIALSGRDTVRLKGLGDVTGVAAKLIMVLADMHLACAGEGRVAEDHTLVRAPDLAEMLGVTEETLRRRISQLRRRVRDLAVPAGLAIPDDNAVVENVPWRGYRLNPDTVRVVRQSASKR